MARFSMDDLVALVVDGEEIAVEPGTQTPDPILNGVPQRDITAVKLEDNEEWLLVKDQHVSAMIFRKAIHE